MFTTETGDSYVLAKVDSGDSANGPFTFASTTYDFGSYKNRVSRIGYNQSHVGTPLKTDDLCFGFTFESHFKPNSTTDFCEFHLTAVFPDAASTEYRIMSWTAEKTTKFIDLGFQASKISWFNPGAGNQAFVMSLGPTSADFGLTSGSTITKHANNQVFHQQLNHTASAYVILPYVDAHDWIVIGSLGASPCQGVQLGNVPFAAFGGTPAAKPVVSGDLTTSLIDVVRSLLDGLASLGWIDDQTTEL